MRVLVMGSGGVGGYFGGMLALHGHEVTFVARGAHLAAMRERGLEIRTGGQTILLRPVRAVESPAEACAHLSSSGAGPEPAEGACPEPAEGAGFDLVLFTVKGYDTEAALAALSASGGVVGPQTAVLTLQNGVDSVDQLSAALGPDHVLAGTARIESTIAEPGVIDQRSPFRRIELGEPTGDVSARAKAIAAALQEAGAEVTVRTDPMVAIWEKFVLLAPNASLTSACQAPVGPIRQAREGAALLHALVSETAAVGRASGVPLADDIVETTIATIQSLPEAFGTSMQRDFERRGRVELEQLTGTVVRRGRELEIATPAFEVVYAILKVRALSFGGL
jgi:2-dehydropantoate 2-reductase